MSDEMMMRLAGIYHEAYNAGMAKLNSEDEPLYTTWNDVVKLFPDEATIAVDAIKAVIAEYEAKLDAESHDAD